VLQIGKTKDLLAPLRKLEGLLVKDELEMIWVEMAVA
jgi:hypothetical protein